MNVLHISTADGWRGGERQIANLLKGIKESYSEVNVYVLCRENQDFHLYCETEHIKYFTYKKKDGKLKNASKIKHICKKNEIDIVHTHDSHGHTLAVLAADFFNNQSKLIIHRRVDFPNSGLLSKYKYNHRKIAAYIPISQEIERILKQIVSVKNQKKIHFIYSSIDIHAIETIKRVSIRKELGLSENSYLIGNISALADHKDYPTFLHVAKNLVNTSKQYHFIIVGEGELEEQLKTLTRELEIETNVHFLGFKSNAIGYLKDFDVFLMTSKLEGLGTSVLEAFAAKTVVVSTNGGGLKETVLHNHTGLSAPVKDINQLTKNVLQVIDNKTLQLRLEKNAYEFVTENFLSEKMVAKTVSIYRQVL